jgi:hypothetical protein
MVSSAPIFAAFVFGSGAFATFTAWAIHDQQRARDTEVLSDKSRPAGGPRRHRRLPTIYFVVYSQSRFPAYPLPRGYRAITNEKSVFV